MGQRDPRIDAYIAGSADFARPILTHLRELVHAACPDCEEALKWSAPSFTYRARILCSMAAFKKHAAFGLWQGAMVMGSLGRKPDTAMGQFGRLTGVADLPGKRELTGYIRQAMKLIEEGVKRAPAKGGKPRPPEAPADLMAALGKNPAARAAFDAFPPSAKREYVEWITEARREETRAKRLVQAVEWMSEGKRRNWKYENC
ncbi:YdeI family protein [Lysobacter niabensis]|uniref:YdeI/OmpD-associated family protein n=1 Tax=Agrilutibacter niabensis TaxID=380628 RepID=UPI00361849C8